VHTARQEVCPLKWTYVSSMHVCTGNACNTRGGYMPLHLVPLAYCMLEPVAVIVISTLPPLGVGVGLRERSWGAQVVGRGCASCLQCR
jgi:hypothetical protein